jgi:peptidoglycan hydrolase-like protein with peptidoglycan-binding domain
VAFRKVIAGWELFVKAQTPAGMTMKIIMKIKYLLILTVIATFALSSVTLAQSTGSSYTFTQNLTIGSTGADVNALQQLLINKGFLTSISTPTGYFGAGTQTALAQFQSANGISPASGYAGPKTRLFLNALNVAGNANATASSGQVLGASTSNENVGAGSSQTSDSGDPPEITINPQVIVGIVCYGDVTYTNQNTGFTVNGPSNVMWDSGSGVIIDSNGDILTNRHVVVFADQFTTITDDNGNTIPVKISAQLNHCEVGQLPVDATLPTPDQIETLNPYVQLPVLGYTAQPAFISNTAGLSSNEIALADFAILKITGVSQSGPTFGVTSVPSSFPYATFLPIQPYPNLDGLVETYGFPGNVSQGQGNFPGTLVMTGSVGHFASMDFGDSFYADTPLTIHTNMEIAHGRSGSPLFWRGYVIGLVTRFDNLDNITESASVATDAIAKGLQNSGYSLSIAGASASTESIPQFQPIYQAQPPAPTENGYQVCSDQFPNETWDGTYSSDGKYNCVCNSGYVLNSTETGCVAQPSCPTFSSYNSAKNQCQCEYGYIPSGGQCVYGGLYCSETYGIGSEYDYSTGGCQCMPGYATYDNRCVTISQLCQKEVGIGSYYLGYDNPNGTYACSSPY